LEKGKYCIRVKGKRRYIIPLTKTDNGIFRINKVSEKAKEDIDNYLNIKHSTYTGFDFYFKLYNFLIINSKPFVVKGFFIAIRILIKSYIVFFNSSSEKF